MASASALKEHGISDFPLSTFPSRIQHGFKTSDLKVTCLDGEKSHFLFGTNSGCAFLHNREAKSNIKLLCESRYDVVTSVKLLIGIECQAALGTSNGKLTIVAFSDANASSAKQVRKYNLGVIHPSSVSCMCWSNNGMKLYTGDKGGNVYVVELDVEKNECNASLLLTEQYEIVQLEYRHRVLLVSTTERVFLYHADKEENKVVSVGTKPTRRGCFGACFNHDTVSSSDLRVFCSRPGFRIWVANIDGKVLSTLQMKDLVLSDLHHIQLFRETDESKIEQTEGQFGKMQRFRGNLLVVYSDSAIFVINPDSHKIEASNRNLNKLLDVAASSDEIFLLRENRRLHRIAEYPEVPEVRISMNHSEENKKKQAESGHLQEVKESLSEMKKTFTPLVGALQSRMSSFNADAEHWSHKIQSQAKVLQKKIPVVATYLFTQMDSNVMPAPPAESSLRRISSSSLESKESSESDIPSSSNAKFKDTSTSERIVVKIVGDNSDVTKEVASHDDPTNQRESDLDFLDRGLKNEIVEKQEIGSSPKTGDQEFLHSQGDPELRKTSVDCHFEKLNFLADEDHEGEIVFNSRRKRKSKTSSSSSKSISDSAFDMKEDNLTSDLHSSRTNIEQESSKVTPVQEPSNFEIVNESSLGEGGVSSGAEGVEILDTLSKNNHLHAKVEGNEKTIEKELISNQVALKEIGSNLTLDLGNLSSETGSDDQPQSSNLLNTLTDTSLIGREDEIEGKSHIEAVKIPFEAHNEEEIIVAVHKTAGNRLTPILSPVSADKLRNAFDFMGIDGSIPQRGDCSPAKNNEQKTVIVPESGNPNMEDNDWPISPKSGDSPLASATKPPAPIPVQKSYAGDREKQLQSRFGGKNPSVVGNLQNKTQMKEINPDYESEEDEIEDDDQAVSLSSGADDIYGVESGSRDFGSEIDSEDDSDKELAFSHSEISSPSECSFMPSASELQYFSSSVPAKLLDSWSLTTSPHQVINISGTENYIWYIDYFDHIYITEETGETVYDIKWRKFQKRGIQLSISPSGVVWLLSRSGKVYAAVFPPSLHQLGEPIVLDWHLVDDSVSQVVLGMDSAWASTFSGGVKVQMGLSRATPYTKSWELIPERREKITHFAMTKTAIFCRTDANKIFTGDSALVDLQGFKWQEVNLPCNRDNKTVLMQSITSDFGYLLWAVDEEGVVWFLTEDRMWWQVNISQYMNESNHLMAPVFMQSLPASFTTSVQKVQRWMAKFICVQGVAVNNQSLWVIYDKQKIQIARGPVTGFRWDITTPLGVAKSTRWQHITTSSVFSPDLGTWIGLIWASQQNSEIFVFPSRDVATIRAATLLPPVEENKSIVCLSACKEALWVLFNDGTILIRSGISSQSFHGSSWDEVDLSTQLGSTKMVHVSCGTQNVWAVDCKGQVFFRIGITAVDRLSLNHAWIPIDGCPTAGNKFVQIECGLSDGSVWAIDDFFNVYVRLGVSFTLPVGESWELVPGSHAQQICISNHTVWGLRVSGNLLRRFGISQKNSVGNYWKKMKGRFVKLAVTPYDELWAIDRDHHLRHQFTSIYCPPVAKAQYEISPREALQSDSLITDKDENDWEII